MKRFFLLSFLFLTSLLVFAQIQQGIVKTRGRMVNGKLVAGTRLNGATITLSFGNPLVSGQNGGFSFNVPSGKSYSLVTAKKQGYTLADPEYTRRLFKYSASNPFYVVLEDEAQRQADINAATRKVRRTLTTQLQAREDEIEQLKEQNRISEQEYQTKLKELYDNQSQSEKLVQDMAERYASTDYDQLNEFNRQILQYIEEGELQKADSMIRSKGDIEKRVAEYHSAVAANKAEHEELKRRQQTLEHSEVGAARTYEDLSLDLLRRSEIFLQAFQQDSALYCLKLRADLDTTNVVAVWQYAELSTKQYKFVESLKYWSICMNASMGNHQAFLQTVNNMAIVFYRLHEYKNSVQSYEMALQLCELLVASDPNNYMAELARTQLNLGSTYMFIKEYVKSEQYLQLALDSYQKLCDMNPDEYRELLAKTQNNLGLLYTNTGQFINADNYYILSLNNYELLFNTDPNKYSPEIAQTQANIGYLCLNNGNYQRSLEYYQLAIENYEQLFKKNPDAYRVDLANTQNSMGTLYSNMGEYETSRKYYILAMANRKHLIEEYPGTYAGDLAQTIYNLGNLYLKTQQYSEAEKCYKTVLDAQQKLFKDNPDAFRQDLMNTQNNLAVLYYRIADYANCLKYYKLMLENKEFLFDQSPEDNREDVASIQMIIADVCENIGNYDDCIKYACLAAEKLEYLYKRNSGIYRERLSLTMQMLIRVYAITGNEKVFETTDKAITLIPTDPTLYNLKGEILLILGKDKEALAMWKKVLELNPNFLDNYPDGTELSNGLKKLGLIE